MILEMIQVQKVKLCMKQNSVEDPQVTHILIAQ